MEQAHYKGLITGKLLINFFSSFLLAHTSFYNNCSFTLISSEHKQQQMPLLTSQSPCALRLGTAWKVLLECRLCYNVMASTLLKSPNEPGCELKKLGNCSFFPKHRDGCLFLDPTKSWLLPIQEENKAGTLRVVTERRKDCPMGKKWPGTFDYYSLSVPFSHFVPQQPVTLPYGILFFYNVVSGTY